MARYQVIVGNIGTVHEGNLLGVARNTFACYVADSKAGYGPRRVAVRIKGIV